MFTSLSSLLMQSVQGPLWQICASFFCLVNPQRCSHRDQFVVILLVMLLLNVVFNNITINGQIKREGVIVLAVAWKTGSHVGLFLNISHSSSTTTTSLGLRSPSDARPTLFGVLSDHIVSQLTRPFFLLQFFFFLTQSTWFFFWFIPS